MQLVTETSTILFDLDGTLLPVNQEEFIELYFQALAGEFTDLAEPEEFINGLWAATKEMMQNQEPRTNQEVFMEAFFRRFPVENEAEIKERFDRFYQEQFPALQEKLTLESKSAGQVIDLLSNAGYSLVLATNPVFPREAVEARLRWINIDPAEFDLLTSYENMCYSKPDPKYYQEIADKLEAAPANCLMVGNDPQEDVIANKVEMKTALIEDFLIEREASARLQPDWQGSWQEFRTLVAKNYS